MPKATIVSEIGNGEYVIQLEYDMVRAIQLKDRNELRVVELNSVIAKLQAIVNTRKAAKNEATTTLDTTIDTEAAATPEGQELSEASADKINAAHRVLQLAIIALDEAEAPLRSDQLLLVQYEKDIELIETALSKYENPVPVEAWCADHTLKLEGEVGVLELADETNSPQDQPTIIQPEGSIKDVKVVQPVISSGAMAIAYNIAAMPAYQKWKPVYRNGIISNINDSANTADVSFSENHEYSSIRGFRFNQAYSIYQDVKIEEIPVVYMDCHAEAFTEGDAVVVEFTMGEIEEGDIEPTYDGTVIGFVTNPFLCPTSIYLESGFLDLLSSGRCTETTFLPATLHFDADTASYNGSLNRPMQLKTELIPHDFTEDSPYFGTPPIEGQESLAVGCLPSQKVNTITDFCRNTHINGGYCGADIVGKKQAQEVIPASMWSGKIRLFVQALYGSIDSTYNKSGNFDLEISYPEDTTGNYSPITLTRGFLKSTILYTTENFDYFLFQYNAGQFTVFPLDLSEQGQNFRNHLLTSSRLSDVDYVKRVEALILSTAKINTSTSAVLSIIGDTILGSPLDYGWHSNWKGDELAVVTFYDDPLLPQYLSTQQKVKITETINSVTGAVSFAIVNTPTSVDSPWWPRTNGLNLFLYSEIKQSMVPVEYPAILLGGFTGLFDSPIYNYYIHDDITGLDTLETINIFMDIQDDHNQNSNFVLPSGTRFDTPQDFITQKRTTYDTPSGGTKGFRSNSKLISITEEQLDQDVLNVNKFQSVAGRGWPFDIGVLQTSLIYPSVADYGAAFGLTFGETKEIWSDEYDRFITADWTYRTTWAWYGTERTFDAGHNLSGSAFGEVLLGDCSAFVFGKTVTESSEGTSFIKTEAYNVFNSYHIPYGGNLEWYWNNNVLGKPTLQIIAGPPPDDAVIFGLGSAANNRIIEDISTDPFPAKTDVEVNFQAGNEDGITTLDNEEILSEYFSPTTSDPETHTVDTGRNSIGNKYKIGHAAFSEDGDFIKDSSVGWS